MKSSSFLKSSFIALFIQFSLGTFFSVFISFFTTIFLTSTLSTNSFAQVSYFGSLITTLSIIFALGLDQAYVRFFNIEKPNSRINFLLYLLILPIIATIIFTGALLLNPVLFSTIFDFPFSINYTLFIGLIIALEIVLRFSLLYFRMSKFGFKYSFLISFQKFIFLCSIILIYLLNINAILNFLLSLILSITLTIFASILFSRNLNNSFNIRFSTKLPVLLKYSLPFLITMTISSQLETVNKIFLVNLKLYEDLALYSVALKIVSILSLVQGLISTFVIPIMYEKLNKNPEKDFFTNLFVSISSLMFLVGLVTILFKDLLILIFDSRYLGAARLIPLLTFFPVFYTISEITMIGINYKKKTQFHIIISISSFLVGLFINVLLTSDLGAIGSAISIASTYLVFFLLRTFIGGFYFAFNLNLKIFIPSFVIFLMNSLFSTFLILNQSALIALNVLSIIIIILITYKFFNHLIKNI
jgi:O-antigen/teichoic acid export membrane protein